MTDVAPCGCLAGKFDSCNSLLSYVHTLVNILWCVRLYIKRKYYYYYYYCYYYEPCFCCTIFIVNHLSLNNLSYDQGNLDEGNVCVD